MADHYNDHPALTFAQHRLNIRRAAGEMQITVAREEQARHDARVAAFQNTQDALTAFAPPSLGAPFTPHGGW